jgi:hypothetical protein
VGNSRAGSQHSFEPVKGSTISEFNHRLIVRGTQRGGDPRTADADRMASAKSLHGFMRGVNKHVRRFNDLGDDTVGDVE